MYRQKYRGSTEIKLGQEYIMEGRSKEALRLAHMAMKLAPFFDMWAEAKQIECYALEGIALQNAKNSEDGKVSVFDANRVNEAYETFRAKTRILPKENVWRIKADMEQKRFNSEVSMQEVACLRIQVKTATMTNDERENLIRLIIKKLAETVELCPRVENYFKVSETLKESNELWTLGPVKQKIVNIAEIVLKVAEIRKEYFELYKSDPAKQRTLNISEKEIVDTFLIAYRIADRISVSTARSEAIAKFNEAAGTDLVDYVNNMIPTLANENPISALDYVNFALKLKKLARAVRKDLKNKRTYLISKISFPAVARKQSSEDTNNQTLGQSDSEIHHRVEIAEEVSEGDSHNDVSRYVGKCCEKCHGTENLSAGRFLYGIRYHPYTNSNNQVHPGSYKELGTKEATFCKSCIKFKMEDVISQSTKKLIRSIILLIVIALGVILPVLMLSFQRSYWYILILLFPLYCIYKLINSVLINIKTVNKNQRDLFNQAADQLAIEANKDKICKEHKEIFQYFKGCSRDLEFSISDGSSVPIAYPLEYRKYK